MAESADDLQMYLKRISYLLYTVKIECQCWKNKISDIFKRSAHEKACIFTTCNESVVEHVKEFKYLGIVFSRSGSFCKAKKHLCEQAPKAMYGVIRKSRQFNLPIN